MKVLKIPTKEANSANYTIKSQLQKALYREYSQSRVPSMKYIGFVLLILSCNLFFHRVPDKGADNTPKTAKQNKNT